MEYCRELIAFVRFCISFENKVIFERSIVLHEGPTCPEN